jgi:aminodeoxyfutalosine deaminase
MSGRAPLPQIGISELHLHLEGSLSVESAIEIAAMRGHAWGALSPLALRRKFRYGSLNDFLAVIREMCIVLSTCDVLERAARELSLSLAASGVEYAEVYCSPYIYVRWGLDFNEVLRSVDRGFAEGAAAGGCDCAILLDSVRQWGPDAAAVILDSFARDPIPRVAGFGLGGEERIPLADFRDIYERARAAGLRTVVHTGEVGPPEDVITAIDVLGVDRIAHGISAVRDRGVLRRLAESNVALDLSVTSNYRTASVRGPHPVRQLVDAGVAVTLSTDDPSLFRTTLPQEYERARRFGRLSDGELAGIARNGVTRSFAAPAQQALLLQRLEKRLSGLPPRMATRSRRVSVSPH